MMSGPEEEVFTRMRNRKAKSKITAAACMGTNPLPLTWAAIEQILSGEWVIGGKVTGSNTVRPAAVSKRSQKLTEEI